MPIPHPRFLRVQADVPDLRDQPYEPHLGTLPPTVEPPENPTILDQGQEGACTGFGLAAVVNMLLMRQQRGTTVSPRMLYALAQRFDEWPGEDYSGSSCRGAIRGWYYNGVCPAADWPYVVDRPGVLTVARARAARSITPGAYYRIAPRVSDYHAALAETGVIYASARVHRGWNRPADGQIQPGGDHTGGHAFAIVGYDDAGFWVQNSWGKTWGAGGIARWLYEDWQANVMDAWVVQLARPTPEVFPGWADVGRPARGEGGGRGRRTPTRAEIAGHFVHLDDGRFHDHGKYFSNFEDVRQTAALLEQSPDYDHLLLYAHGGLNSVSDSAQRIREMKDVFKENRIYPYHFMWDTGLFEELKDVILGTGRRSEHRVGAFSDISDRIIERLTSRVGTLVWDEMKAGAERPFERRSADGLRAVRALMEAAGRNTSAPKGVKVHLVGHSAGAILLSRLIEALAGQNEGLAFSTLTLWAPAVRHDAFAARVIPQIGRHKRIASLRISVLSDELERDDTVTPLYRKSLLYLVSRAFEGSNPADLLGLVRDLNELPAVIRRRVFVSRGVDADGELSAARTHGGFDNDHRSLNTLLQDVLGRAPARPFREGEITV